MKRKICVVGAGPAGCFFACFVNGYDITLFDKREPLKTLLVTGNGRCNLANAIYDFKELAKNYPRGEKFLYSIFSRFATQDTLDFFKSIGVECYTQEDNRIFPQSNSAKDVRDYLLKKLKQKNVKFKQENVINIKKVDDKFLVNDKYLYDDIVISIGGHSNFNLIRQLEHKVIEPKPSLLALITKEKFDLEGVSLKNVEIGIEGLKKKFKGDLLFTSNGISGPLAFTVSSVFAREDYSEKNPINLYINFANTDLLSVLNTNGKKYVKNIISEYVPKSLAEYICKNLSLQDVKCCDVSKEKRVLIESMLSHFNLTVIGHALAGEIVTSGGVDLDEIDSKTMQSKIIKGLYFCGEVINVDGYCGGFNLQSAWSTAFVASQNFS